LIYIKNKKTRVLVSAAHNGNKEKKDSICLELLS
jgi:hypothetical protein